jgi:hypothetical protein
MPSAMMDLGSIRELMETWDFIWMLILLALPIPEQCR